MLMLGVMNWFRMRKRLVVSWFKLLIRLMMNRLWMRLRVVKGHVVNFLVNNWLMMNQMLIFVVHGLVM